MTAFEAWLDRIAYVQWALVPLVVVAGIGATVARSRAATRTGLATVLLAAMLVPFFVPVLQDPGAALDATRRDFAATPYSRAVEVPLHETSTDKASPPSVAHGSEFSPVRFRIPTWLWMTGTMLLAARALAGIVRTRRRLRGMPDAPNDVLREVGSIAEDLVVRAPRCVLSNERCSPAVYCLGAPVLILPAALWRSLDADARRALLVHELAHVKRRDGLLRAVAGVASCLVWWNPVVWWLRARLRSHSEDACDAWVGAIDDEAPTTFTRALLETERFLGGVPLRPRPALIPVASGKARALGRRLRRIVEVAPHRASGLGVSFVAVLALAASTTGWIGVQATAPARANAADGVDDALALGRSARPSRSHRPIAAACRRRNGSRTPSRSGDNASRSGNGRRAPTRRRRDRQFLRAGYGRRPRPPRRARKGSFTERPTRSRRRDRPHRTAHRSRSARVALRSSTTRLFVACAPRGRRCPRALGTRVNAFDAVHH